MNKVISTLLFFLFCHQSFAAPSELGLASQYGKPKKKTSGFDKTRLLLGPGIGAGAAYRAFSFNLSPTVGYAFNENFNAGVTLGFNYFQQAEDYTNPITNKLETFRYKYPGYSFSVYARYLLKQFLMFNFEPEINNVKFVKGYSIDLVTGKIIENKQRITVPSVLVGLGYMQRFGKYSYSFISLNYDLVQNPNARYYQTLDYRFGLMIQLFN
jgi:hypothetical protein